MRFWFLMLALIWFYGCAVKYYPPENSNDGFSVTLSATGKIEAYPDMASIRLNITCLSPDVDSGKQCVETADLKLKENLKSLKVGDSSYHAGPLTRWHEYSWNEGERKFQGYETRKEVDLNLFQVDQLGAVLNLLLSQKEINIVNTGFSHTRTDSLKTQAYLKALDELKHRSELIRKHLGVENCKILSVSDGNNSRLAPEPLGFSGAMMMRADKASGQLDMAANIMVFEAFAAMSLTCK